MTVQGKTPADAPGWRESEISDEARAQTLRRLKIRCWRRGWREMDLLLGGFVDGAGMSLTDEEIGAFDVLIREDDSAIYAWISGTREIPAEHALILGRIRAFHAVD